MKRFLLPLLFLPLSAFAWTRTSDERIAAKAASLAPPDLRLILQKFETNYRNGIAIAQGDEGSDTHHAFVLSRSGRLRERITAETAKVITMLRTRAPMASVAERIGVLAHLVADANNPFHVANDDPRLDPAHDDFEQYFERRLAKFPTVFYGLDERPDVNAIVDRALARTRRFYPLMDSEYLYDGELQSSEGFDDHSTAFGVAAVCYSHAVTDIVNLEYYIWREAGGDVRAASALREGNLVLRNGN